MSNWLLSLCGLIFVMVVVGGITRLTESGLSITEWKPITGAIPPLTEAQWLREFELYKRIPEYQQINRGMSLEDFKNIFFWEWAHRQLGRVIGLAALLPLAWFAFKKAIPQGYGWRTGSIFLLVCVQGAIGWWMVASGLTERTDVSHVRLAVHLLTALFIFGFALWTALDLRAPGAVPRKIPTLGLWAFAALAIQLLFGAYVAGLDAGYAFNTWPLMGDSLYPAAAPWLEPFFRNFVDNPITVQFIHRWWAFVVVAVRGGAGAQAQAGAAASIRSRFTRRSARRSCSASGPCGRASTCMSRWRTRRRRCWWWRASWRACTGWRRARCLDLLGTNGCEAGPLVPGRVEPMSIVTVYCVFADEAEARRIGRLVVEEELAACVNILGPCRSIYRWDGRIEEASEVPALFKTTAEGAERLVERLALLHSYDVPAITVWPIDRRSERPMRAGCEGPAIRQG